MEMKSFALIGVGTVDDKFVSAPISGLQKVFIVAKISSDFSRAHFIIVFIHKILSSFSLNPVIYYLSPIPQKFWSVSYVTIISEKSKLYFKENSEILGKSDIFQMFPYQTFST